MALPQRILYLIPDLPPNYVKQISRLWGYGWWTKVRWKWFGNLIKQPNRQLKTWLNILRLKFVMQLLAFSYIIVLAYPVGSQLVATSNPTFHRLGSRWYRAVLFVVWFWEVALVTSALIGSWAPATYRLYNNNLGGSSVYPFQRYTICGLSS